MAEEGVPPPTVESLLSELTSQSSLPAKYNVIDQWSVGEVGRWLEDRFGDPLLAQRVQNLQIAGDRFKDLDENLQEQLEIDQTLYCKILKRLAALNDAKKDVFRQTWRAMAGDVVSDVAQPPTPASASAHLNLDPDPEHPRASRSAGTAAPAIASPPPPDRFRRLHSQEFGISGVTLVDVEHSTRFSGQLRLSPSLMQLVPELGDGSTAVRIPLHLVKQTGNSPVESGGSLFGLASSYAIEADVQINEGEYLLRISLEFCDKKSRDVVLRKLKIGPQKQQSLRASSTCTGTMKLGGLYAGKIVEPSVSVEPNLEPELGGRSMAGSLVASGSLTTGIVQGFGDENNDTVVIPTGVTIVSDVKSSGEGQKGFRTFVVECRLKMEPPVSSSADSPRPSASLAPSMPSTKGIDTAAIWHVNRRYSEFKRLREQLSAVESWSRHERFLALPFPPGESEL